MQRQPKVAITGFTIAELVMLLAFAPGCPQDGGEGDQGAQHDRTPTASGDGSGGSASQGNHAGTGGEPANSGTGGHDQGSGVTRDAGAEKHDAGRAGDGSHEDDAGAKPHDDGGTPTCDIDCEAGTHCELVEVQCIRAPCNPVAQCVDDVAARRFCGGIAAFDCPGMGECVDDTTDDCDPNNGGADCGGVCECAKAASCTADKHWNGSPDVCACLANDGSDDGPKCGDKTCAKGQECCDALCGICVEPGIFCTQGC